MTLNHAGALPRQVHPGLRRAFAGFHLILGLVVLTESVRTVLHAVTRPGALDLHLAALAGVEAMGAVLFQLPRTLRLGGGLQLATFAIAMLAHGLRGQFPTVLLVYAAGTSLVMVHGSVWGRDHRHEAMSL